MWFVGCAAGCVSSFWPGRCCCTPVIQAVDLMTASKLNFK